MGERITYASKILAEERELLVYFPAGYQQSQTSYPLLVLLDGDAHFLHVSGIVQFLSRQGLIPPMLVVAIPNVDRNYDFTPTKEENRTSGGGADKFLRFLSDELIPYLDANYRTEPFRILFGHSLTGMFSIYSLLQEPGVFNAHIAASPWVIYDNNYLINQAPRLLKKRYNSNRFLYMTVGNEPDLIPALDEFRRILKQKNPSGLHRKYREMEKEDHGSVVHLTVYDGLLWIYDGWQLPSNLAEKGPEALEAHFRKLSDKLGYSIPVPEAIVNNMGYRLLFQNQNEKALQLFLYNVKMHPESPNVYDSLGECYEALGRTEEAMKNYKIAVEKGEMSGDPNQSIYRDHLRKIQDQTSDS